MRRPLSDLAIGISISEGEDLRTYGLSPPDVGRMTVELCRRFVALGAQIVLGHQWRPRGIMEAVTRFAQAYQTEAAAPIVLNFLAWPDRAALSPKDRDQLKGLLAIYEADQPPRASPAPDRVGALREMRKRMATANHARICLSGKLYALSGFPSGLLEEAVLTLRENKPVYFSRMMGGTSALLVDIVQGRKPPTILPNEDSTSHGEYLEHLASLGESNLASICGLSLADLQQLFDAPNVDTIIHLTSRGLLNRFPRN